MLAFKEWSYIVDALGKGKQSIILRKGGISEDGGDFAIKGKKFLLLPTQYHQARELIKPEWLTDLEGDRYFSSDNKTKIEFFAEIADHRVISDWNILEKLHPQHAWNMDIIKERYNRWEKNVHLLIVQVYKLKKPFELEMLPQYGGCKSWIEVEDEIELEGEQVVNKSVIQS